MGANWHACAAFDLRTELFDKNHQFEASGFGANLGDHYRLSSDFKGAKVTAIVKPLPQLSFTTRYVYQSGKMQVAGYLPTSPSFDSCNAKSYDLGETIDWTPIPILYVQLSGNLVNNTISTIYPRAGITPASGSTSAYDTNGVLQDSHNNYVTANFLLGVAVARHTDVQAQFTYYKATNGNAALAAMTQPYGAAAQESVATIGIKQKLSDKLVLNAKVGYADSANDTTGGFTSYHGPMAYVSLEYAL